MAGGRAAAKPISGFIGKRVASLFRIVVKDAEKGAGKRAARTAERRAARTGARDLERGTARRAGDRPLCNDPVDVSSGHVVLHQVDVDLPAALPLVLVRAHVSSYREGRLFGPNWASTLDQRLEVDATSVRYVGDDGMVLHYPRPEIGETVLPSEGPRLTLTRVPAGYRVRDPRAGRVLEFELATTGPDRRLVAIVDNHGDRIDVDYRPDGTLDGLRHSGGYRIAVDTESDRVTAYRLVDQARGEGVALVRFGYDERGRLTEVINSSGSALRFDYDDDGRLTEWRDRNDSWYRYAYDDEGRCVRSWGTGGYLDATYAYDPDNRVTVLTTSLGHTREYHLNDDGQVVREVDPLGHAVTSEWDRYDRLLARTDPLGRTTRFDYDDAGNVTAVTRPDGSRVSTEYDANGRPIAFVNPAGAVWRATVDANGDRTSLTDPTGATTRYEYGAPGRLTALTDPVGRVFRYEHTPAGLLASVTDPSGASTRYSYDMCGRLAAITDPLGHVSRFGWTVEGKLVWRIGPDGATERWSYDGEGNILAYTDPAGRVTAVEYTAFDLPAAQTGPDGGRIEFAYDTELRLVALTNPAGLVWRYEYDPAGNLTAETDVDGRRITYRHDPAGQRVERVVGAGPAITTRYDELGAVVEERAGDDVSRFAYDPDGWLVRATNAAADVTFERDPTGRVLAETRDGLTVTSRYDAAGRRILLRGPSGAESEWEYTANDQPSALRRAGHVLRFDYDAAGREVRRALDPSVVLTQTWAGYRMTTQTLTAAAPPWQSGPDRGDRLVGRRAYTYDPTGHLTGVEDQLTGSARVDLDPAGRIGALTAADVAERYSYDQLGAVTAATWSSRWPQPEGATALAGDREYTGTRISRAGRVRFDYDERGRVVGRAHRTLSGQTRVWRYTWDDRDRLSAITTPDGRTWSYAYDALGRRIAKLRHAEDGTVLERTRFVWDGDNILERVETGPGGDRATGWDFAPGTGVPVSQTERVRDPSQEWVDREFYAIVTDVVGAPSELVDPDGRLAWWARPTVWGGPVGRSAGTVDCPIRFPGQYHDAETGLHYNRFRYYDPYTGRYQSPDPLGANPGPDPYGYAPNPWTQIDPFGLRICDNPTPYRSSDLSERAYQHRARHSLGANRNVAVAEYRDAAGNLHHIERSNTPGGPFRKGTHAEEHLDQELRRRGVHPDSVTRIYSERIPCATPGHECWMTVSRYRHATTSWTFPGSLEGSARDLAPHLDYL